MSGFLRRVLKLGQLPTEVAAAIDGADAVLVAEGISVRTSGKLKSPQRRSSGFTSMHSGALVILPGRVLASFGRYLVLDDHLAPTADDDRPTCTTCTIDADGLDVHLDVERLIPGGTGHVDIAFRTVVPAAALSALPALRWSGHVAAPDPARMLMRV